MTTADDYINRVLGHMPRATPLRTQIATELRGHISERVGNGQPLDDVLQHLGDPMTLAESYLAAVPLRAGSFWGRAAAKIVDFLVVLLPILAMLGAAWQFEITRLFGLSRDYAPPIMFFLAAVVGPVIFGIYTATAECVTGQTIGKQMFHLRVVRESGARISIGQAIVRQLPMFLQIAWIDVLFALATDKSQRAFEMLSKTRVVRVEPDGR